MDIEKLYQDVWARVFAQVWAQGAAEGKNMDYPAHKRGAAVDADAAAKAAVEAWDPAKAHAVIAAKEAKS